ncbi:hypothetical protein BH11GEM2_BH11GEM2_32770 [soil metagenome]
MTFLAPWAFAIGVLSAFGVVVFHLVARTRPAAYLLPTARFIPDQRSVVSRVASRPRDLLLLALRVLLLLAASAAFARPVLTPTRGTIGHIVLVDRSRAVSSVEVAKARALVPAGARPVVIAFDSMPVILAGSAWDSLVALPRSEAPGSLTAALIAARRASVALSAVVDSVQLHIVSPVSRSEVDAGAMLARAAWPGVIDVQRSAVRADPLSATWGMSRAISVTDPLGPSVVGLKSVALGKTSQLVRGALSAADSAFARSGGTIVRWDTASTARVAAEGLAVGDDVIVATLGRVRGLPSGRVVARWADATPAAVEEILGTGCVRTVGVMLPFAGDLPLHPPFQRLARGLLAPCGFATPEVLADSSVVASLAGGSPAGGSRVAAMTRMASARDLRASVDQPSPIARWLLLVALALAVAELVVRTRGPVEAAA